MNSLSSAVILPVSQRISRIDRADLTRISKIIEQSPEDHFAALSDVLGLDTAFRADAVYALTLLKPRQSYGKASDFNLLDRSIRALRDIANNIEESDNQRNRAVYWIYNLAYTDRAAHTPAREALLQIDIAAAQDYVDRLLLNVRDRVEVLENNLDLYEKFGRQAGDAELPIKAPVTYAVIAFTSAVEGRLLEADKNRVTDRYRDDEKAEKVMNLLQRVIDAGIAPKIASYGRKYFKRNIEAAKLA